MVSSHPPPAPPRTSATARRTIHQRLDAIEANQRLLERTLCGLAREYGVIVAGPCPRCCKANMLGSDGTVHCPHCGNRHSI